MRVYLTGPISGVSYDRIAGWRRRVTTLLPSNVEVYDPAAFTYNADLAYQEQESPFEAFARRQHGQLVVDRNKYIIQSSSVVMANFLGADRASIGSVGELFWASALSIPIVIVREPSGNVHDHAMLNGIARVISSSLEEGCHAVRDILGV